eukprot:4647125-Pyramimonas_sp.AAC.1
MGLCASHEFVVAAGGALARFAPRRSRALRANVAAVPSWGTWWLPGEIGVSFIRPRPSGWGPVARASLSAARVSLRRARALVRRQ